MITLESLYQDVVGGFSSDYPFMEFYEGDEKKIYYMKDFQKKTKAVAALLEKKLAGIEKGRFIGIKHETHPFWFCVLYGLGMCGYNVMFLDENANDIILHNCIDMGNLGAIIGKKDDSKEVLCLDFDEIVSASEGEPENKKWGEMICLCTSGTTGIAKTVVFKAKTITRIHRVLRATLLGHPYNLESCYDLDIDKMKVLATLPMRHIFGFEVPSIYWGFGCTFVFPKNQGVLELVRVIKEDGIWSTYGVPALWKAIFNVYKSRTSEINQETFEEFFGKQFKNGLIGGAKIDEDLKPFLKSVGFQMANTYGQTETGGAISLGYLTEEKSMNGIPGYSGQLFNGHRAGIINSEGEWVPNGKGELAVKGLDIYDGILRGGQFISREEEYGELQHTGDMFLIDGVDFYCMGRADNMIINDAGENIYVEELEEDFAFLKEETKQYAAVGVNNRPILVLYGHDDDEEKLVEKIAKVNKTLPHYKRIENAYVLSAKLPVTSKNEVDRKALEETISLRMSEDADSVRKYNLRQIGKKVS